MGTDSSVYGCCIRFCNVKRHAAMGALGGNVSAAQLLARQTGQIFNPNMELLLMAYT